MPSVEELQKSFNAKGLEDKIAEKLGFTPAGLKIELKAFDYGHSRGIGVFVSSDNLIDKVGIMNQVFKSVEISTPNYSVKRNPEGALVSWSSIDFAWEHINGGSNGGDWFTAWYNFDTKAWSFRDK